MRVGIINLNSGNLLSVVSAVEKSGFETSVIDKPGDNFDALIMPGQGRFAFVANQLDNNNWRPFVTEWINSNKKFIGICVGMQVLFEGSSEDIDSKGLGLLSGLVEKLNHNVTPMVGWAKLQSVDEKLKEQYVYFVNSYGVPASEYCTSTVDYGNKFCASIQKNNLYAFQFHPEKSGTYGQELLRTCLN